MFYYLISGTILKITEFTVVRAIFALLTALAITLFLVPKIIKNIQARHAGQNIRKLGPETHQQKAGRPTMGGIAMVIAIILAALVWCRLDNITIIIMLISTFWLGLVGFLDDMLKFIKKSSDGLSAKAKLFFQVALGVLVGIFIYWNNLLPPTVYFPIVNTEINIGIWYILFVTIIITGFSNAVNLTDGLDGLATGVVILVTSALGGIAYITGNAIFSKHVGLMHLPGSNELSIFCAAMVGAGLGFFWYNASPAEIFMGDVGSLALGGAIGGIAIFTKSEILLAIIGGIFVIEALSVMIQVFSFKTFGKRVFKMSPIHHHFELSGWPETKVVARFWIITVILILVGLCIIGLNTLVANKLLS
ncbi:MAG: phospho-N-acetylmuramoyl-pentapeptide-transferase [Candidatus Wallbacteria bacterium]